jgi:hypothetical protein
MQVPRGTRVPVRMTVPMAEALEMLTPMPMAARRRCFCSWMRLMCCSKRAADRYWSGEGEQNYGDLEGQSQVILARALLKTLVKSDLRKSHTSSCQPLVNKTFRSLIIIAKHSGSKYRYTCKQITPGTMVCARVQNIPGTMAMLCARIQIIPGTMLCGRVLLLARSFFRRNTPVEWPACRRIWGSNLISKIFACRRIWGSNLRLSENLSDTTYYNLGK